LLTLARVRLQRLSPIGNCRNRAAAAENAANFFRSSTPRAAGYCQDALTAGRSGDARLKQAFLNPIASVALIPHHKQGLIGCKRNRARLGEQAVSGAKTDRPELAKLIGRLESSDVLVVIREELVQRDVT